MHIKTALLAITGLAAGAAASAQDITVSSKIDTEGGLLGNMIALALEDAGLPVERRLQLGGTQVVREALLAGQIDIYPEYTGNAAFFFNEADSEVWKDAEAAHQRAKELDAEANGIVWLDAAPANNTWAIAEKWELTDGDGLNGKDYPENNDLITPENPYAICSNHPFRPCSCLRLCRLGRAADQHSRV